MVQSKAQTVKEYLAELSPDRRKSIEAVRKVILANLPEGYEEGMGCGMIAYYVPLSRFPNTYNGQPLSIVALASQKNYMSVHLMCVYGDKKTLDWFTAGYKASGKKLDMGKGCVRFKRLEDLPLDLIGEAVGRVSVEKFREIYEQSRKKK